MIKSIINSKQFKSKILNTVDKALEDCSSQQESWGLSYIENVDHDNVILINSFKHSLELKKLAETKPTRVKITIEFYFGEDTHNNKYGQLICAPIIDLI
jgi:hypothetical protein